MTELKETKLGEALNEKNAESEGSIQSLFLDQEITLKSAQIRESKNNDTGDSFKVAFIHVEDSTGKQRVCNSSATAIVSKIEELLQNGLGKTIKVPVRCVNVVRDQKKDYLKLEEV